MIHRHTSETLEFPKVIACIHGKCITPYGHSEVDRFAPMFDRDEIVTRQSEIAQMKDIINFGLAFPLYRVEDAREILSKVRVEGTFLDPREIRVVLELVEVSISLHGYDRDGRENFPNIAEHLRNLRAFPELKKEINRAIDIDGTIKDSASSSLKHIRMDLASSKQKILARLGKILSAQQKQAGWQDDVITQRNDRYVIPIVANQYRSNQGILHDRSQSGATFYIEPNETVELNNRVNLLMQEEKAEIIRILKALSAEIAQREDALAENTRLIGWLDALHAAGDFSNCINANRVTIEGRAHFDITEARHPLLILQSDDAEKVIPLSLRLDENRQAILITGPNTGGKTIALKTIGLMVLMAQSGLLIPAKETSTVGVFQQVFADIGDEQSIELSLSTFSSHIKNISEAVTNVSDETLALLDEIGAGTDPKEGSALAESIILHMVERGARMVASTHYSQLKTLALDHPEIENASLEFDRQTLAPTYRLQMGIPGSSYAVEIAGRLGIPRSICKHASELLGSGERSLGELIASLETELLQVREDKVKLTDRLIKVEELERYYKAETEKFKTEIEQSRDEALGDTDHLLDNTRKEIERLVAEIRRSQADKKSVKEIHHLLKVTEERVNKLRGKQRGRKTTPSEPTRLEVGDPVRIISLNKEGEVESLIGTDKARVRVGAVNTVVEKRNLEKLARGPRDISKQHSVATPDTGEMSPEIHLRGMTTDEATDALDLFLDRAVVAGLGQVYVIHGKGTGALRKNLTSFLKQHREVDSLRLGNWNEGGAGVTIVKLKK
ncbi:MAG: endonuclease MutS2 [bacterium]|nr:endonuclease MutS2 [bacterium]